MELKGNNLEDIAFEYIDKFKLLFSAGIWQNVLMDCSKNELFILLLLYRQNEVNMTQIAEYIEAPLNTATGIVARMEKKKVVIRERSPEDKRIVTIRMTEEGKECIKSIIEGFLHYAGLITESFSANEIQLVFRLVDKIIKVLTMDQERRMQAEKSTGIKKIEID